MLDASGITRPGSELTGSASLNRYGARMSLAVAVPCAVLAAITYGASTALQHSAAHRSTGRADPRGLVRLLGNSRWLMSIGGDAVGLLLQVVALATGPVVLVQPILVLAVPVSLPVARALGGPKPRRGDYLACSAIIVGLAAFFVIVGDPGSGRPLRPGAAAIATGLVLGIGGVACAAVRTRSARLRAGTYGGVAGALFGLVGVLLNAASRTWQQDGLAGLGHPTGWVPLAGALIVGAVALTLTQISFQVGEFAASFPANEAAAPVVAVVLGAGLLHEQVPVSPLTLVAYLACVACVLAGAIQLAGSGEAGGDGPKAR